MSDNSRYEYWDFRSEESSVQFRLFKDVRKNLIPYENYFNRLLEKLTAESVAKKGKTKGIFELPYIQDGEEVMVRLKAQKDKKRNIPYCEEVIMTDPKKDTNWAWIGFDKEGKVKKITIDDTSRSTAQERIPLVESFLLLGDPDGGPSAFQEDNLPVKGLEFFTEKPIELGLYASFSEGKQLRKYVDRNGNFPLSDMRFADLLLVALEAIIPQPILDAIEPQ